MAWIIRRFAVPVEPEDVHHRRSRAHPQDELSKVTLFPLRAGLVNPRLRAEVCNLRGGAMGKVSGIGGARRLRALTSGVLTMQASGTLRRRSMAGAAALTLLSVGGCSTVESVDLSKTQDPERADAYINYSVAKSIFTIQVTSAGGGPAAASGGAPATTTPASTPTSWTLNGTITAAGSGGGGGGGGGGSTDSTTCGALTAEYAAAQSQVAAAISTWGGLRARLRTLASGANGKGDTPAKLAKDAQAYVATVSADSYQQLFTINAGDGQLRIYDEITAQCPPIVSVSVSQAVAPDNSRTFALKARNNPLYTDALTLSTDANGFLTSGSPSSVSQIPAILSSVASDIGEFSLPGAPVVAGAAGERHEAPTPGARRRPQPTPKPLCRAELVSGLTAQLRALAACKATELPAASFLANQVLGDLTAPGALQNLPAAALPLTIYASIEDLPSSPGVTPAVTASETGKSIAARLASYHVSLYLDCSPRTSAHVGDGIPETASDSDDYDRPTATGVYDGLIVSASRACRFQARQDRPVQGQVLVAQNFLWAQDSRYLVRLPTQRGLLVARSVTYNFAGGQATGVTDSRPSEIQALVALPGAVVGSFFTGVSSAVTNGQTLTSAKTANLSAQTAYWNAQTASLTAKHNLSNAQQGVFPSSGGSSSGN